jgi:hypothetical protein
MNSKAEYTIKEDKYHVVTVEKSVPPPGIDAGNWYRYVIGQGKSNIEGIKLGTLQAVTEHAQAMVDDLNTRAARSGSFYAPRLYTTRKRK